MDDFDRTVAQVLQAAAVVLAAAFVVDEFTGGGLRGVVAERWTALRGQVALDEPEPVSLPEPSAADVSDVLDHANRITKGGLWP